MQTNEIASLFVDCKAQTSTSSTPIFADSVLFGTTLTEALATMDRQNLPAETKNPEDLSTESAEVGNCLALTWNIIPLLAASSSPTGPTVAEPIPSPTPDGDPIPKTDSDMIRQTAMSELKVSPESISPPAKEPPSVADTVSTPLPESPSQSTERAVPCQSPTTEEAPPNEVHDEVRETTVGSSSALASQGTNPAGIPEKAGNDRRGEESRVHSKPEKRNAVVVNKRAPSPPDDAAAVSESNDEAVVVQSSPATITTEIPVQNVEMGTPVQAVAMPPVPSVETAKVPEPIAPGAVSKFSTAELPQSSQVAELAKETQNAEDQRPQAAPDPQPEVKPERNADNESSAQRFKTAQSGALQRKDKESVTKPARPEANNRDTERNESQAPAISVQSDAYNKGTTNSQQDKSRKQEPAAEVFQQVIHRTLSSSGAVVEEAKPVAAVAQSAIEPAVLHRVATNLSGYSSAAATPEVLTEPQKASVISQIIDKAQLLGKGDSAEIVVALKPDSLGRITLRASMVDNELVTTIVAESHAVKAALQADLPALHTFLQEAGMESAKVIVTREADMNFSGTPSNSAFNFQQSHHSNHQQGGPSHRYEELLGMNMEPRKGEVASVQMPLDSRYSARSIHFIA